jgi:hypothetical protein
VAYRLSELGTWGLSNDEAWVALATRVEGLQQFWLAIAMTPVGWAALLKGVTVVFGGSELALRAVPFAFGCLSMRAALDAGRRVTGHWLGGVAALAAVAFDPLGITYGRILKQYTAEAFFCILAIDRAAVFAARRRRRDLLVLTLVLAGGLAFANTQLFLAPPVLATLLVHAIVRRDRRAIGDVLVATVAVGLWDALYYRVLIAPRLPTVFDAYWGAQVYLSTDPQAAATLLWQRLGWALVPALGPRGFALGMVCVLVGCLAPRARVALLALVLLVAEIVALSMLHRFPVSQPRILVFVTTALAAFGAAAIALVVVRAFTRVMASAIGCVLVALLVYDFAGAHAWRALPRTMAVEDVGPPVRLVERDRLPTDVVLEHQSTLFIYAYYQRATPVLDPLPSISVGWVPRRPDARVVLVNDDDMEAQARTALAAGSRVWLLASRLRAPREKRLRDTFATLGPPTRDERRPGAFLLMVGRPTP